MAEEETTAARQVLRLLGLVVLAAITSGAWFVLAGDRLASLSTRKLLVGVVVIQAVVFGVPALVLDRRRRSQGADQMISK